MDLFLYSSDRHLNWNLYDSLNLSDLDLFLDDYFSHLALDYLRFLDDFENLPNDLDFFWWQLNDLLNCHDFLYYLRNLNDFLLDLDDWHYFLYNLLDNLDSGLDVRHNLWNFFIFNDLNYLLYDLRHLNYGLFFNDFFNYFLNYDLDRFYNFFFSLNVPNNFFDHFKRFNFFLNNDFLSLNLNRNFSLDNLLDNPILRLKFCFFSDLNCNSFMNLRM